MHIVTTYGIPSVGFSKYVRMLLEQLPVADRVNKLIISKQYVSMHSARIASIVIIPVNVVFFICLSPLVHFFY